MALSYADIRPAETAGSVACFWIRLGRHGEAQGDEDQWAMGKSKWRRESCHLASTALEI